MKVVIASSNTGKIVELQAQFAALSLPLTIIPQRELQVMDIAETGLTFVENALLKARHAAAQTGLPALADDSGLAVAALQGAPGIYSARYAGATANDRANLEKLLHALQEIPVSARQAAYHCVLVYLRHAHDPTPLICQAHWSGEILRAPQGAAGFGYDPIFYVPTEGKTAAELPLARKNLLSHRGQALRCLVKNLAPELRH